MNFDKRFNLVRAFISVWFVACAIGAGFALYASWHFIEKVW